jgi:hypothetical protein
MNLGLVTPDIIRLRLKVEEELAGFGRELRPRAPAATKVRLVAGNFRAGGTLRVRGGFHACAIARIGVAPDISLGQSPKVGNRILINFEVRGFGGGAKCVVELNVYILIPR